MLPCPTCGVRLADLLVAAIVNPLREESCPKALAGRVRQREKKRQKKETSLVALMMLGSKMGDIQESRFDGTR